MSDEDHVSREDSEDAVGTAVVPSRNGTGSPAKIAIPPVLAGLIPTRERKARESKGRPRKSKGSQPRFGSFMKEQRLERRERRNTKNGRMVTVVAILCLAIGPLAFVRTLGLSTRIESVSTEQKTKDQDVEKRITQYGLLSEFPLGEAKAQAIRLAHECFTHENRRETTQLKKLQASLIPPEYCTWNGKGTTQVISAVTVDAPYWVKATEAFVIVQVKLFRQVGFFYLYVPFIKDGQSAKFAGMPSLFGVGSGATEVVSDCTGVEVAPEEEKAFTQTANDFLKGLTGELEIDVRRVTGGRTFGDFNEAVKAPKVEDVTACQKIGKKIVFTAVVRFDGPGKGAQFRFPYAFLATPKGGLFELEKFGPMPISKEG